MRKIRTISLCLVLCFVLPGISFAADYENLITFGDSLTDSGNISALLGPGGWEATYPEYNSGNFSNGPVWAEYLAGRMGVDGNYLITVTDPTTIAGTRWHNNAFGGAETGAVSGPSDEPTGFLSQVGTWSSLSAAIPANSLCVVWIGGNDYLNWDENPPTPANQAVTNIIAGLTTMVNDLDATDILVINLPDLGKSPLNNADPTTSATATALTQEFNAALETALDAFALANPAINLMQLDIFSFVNEIIADPAAYGFLNVTNRGIDDFATDGFNNSGQYLFWDNVHPTTEAHELVADEVYDIAFDDDSSSGSGGCFIYALKN
jgi:phospholipase/lecithinase/hemolysin